MFADQRLLDWLAWFREAIDRPVIVNTYGEGGHFTQRGYRCNLCPIIMDKTIDREMYLSAHTRFQAVDFNVNGMTDDEVKKWIDDHKTEMPHRIRIEKNTTGWNHIDVATDNKDLITYFNG